MYIPPGYSNGPRAGGVAAGAPAPPRRGHSGPPSTLTAAATRPNDELPCGNVSSVDNVYQGKNSSDPLRTGTDRQTETTGKS